MTIHKARSTDSPYKPPPHLILSREDARNAPGPTWHCGWCTFSAPETDHKAIRDHRCVNAAGRDMTEIKRLHAEGTKPEYEALSRFTPPPCELCGDSFPPGTQHDCGLPTTVMPHDRAAAAWQRQGMAQLAQDLKETS